jgi:hypothetical protein
LPDVRSHQPAAVLQTTAREGEMDISDRLFVILFFPDLFISLGVFFLGVGYLWWISIQDRELKRKRDA